MRADRRLIAVLIAFTLGACGFGCTSAQAAPQLEVVDAFATPGSDTVAVYVQIANAGGPDELTGATVLRPWSADAVTLHQTRNSNGLSTMVPVEAIEIAGDGPTSLGPGQAHLMLEGLDAPLALGDELRLRLTFHTSAPQVVTVNVIDPADALERISPNEEDDR